MPQRAFASGQDWDSVNVGRAALKKPTVPKTAAALSAAKASGLVVTERRFAAGSNASAHNASSVNARKLEESEDLKHAKVDKSLSQAIQQARMAKKKTQKELATLINEKTQVVQEYESGKAIPNGQIIAKIERALGCKLPRPGKKPKPKPEAGSGTGARVGGAGRGGGVQRGNGPARRR